MIQKLLLLCLAFWLCLFPSHSFAFTGQFDLHFKRWGEFYFPFHDWKHWKAQGLAESGLNPKALSWCGARGIMQLMPGTAKDLGVNPFSSEANIQGGVKYDAQLYKIWKAIPSDIDRLDFTFASYNAGPGNIIKAYRLAGSKKWEDTNAKLPAVTGKNAKETQGYIVHIREFYRKIQ